MAVKGERFEIDLDSSEDEDTHTQFSTTRPFIGDILEKDNENFTPPAPPRFKPTQNGFPEARQRKGPSRFKRQTSRQPDSGRDAPSSGTAASSAKKTVTFDATEMERIDQENRDRLNNMSPEEIEEERKELFSGLSGSLIERLLKRSTIEEPQEDFDKPLRDSMRLEQEQKDTTEELVPSKQKKTVTFAPAEAPRDSPAAQVELPQEPSTTETVPSVRSIHFPTAPVPPLDPSSSSFLHDLHQKYFPTLPFDPNALSWMAPLSADQSRDYSAASTSFHPAELRFDFSGNLLPPNLAHQIPTTKGLHHHGLAPEAAGYTLAELSIYSRSTVQAQRCMAFQTLGRFLFKLGTGTFGDDGGADNTLDEDDGGAVLCRGLWTEVKKERVLDILIEEAGKDEALTRHRSAHAMAVEAVWLWRRGGGRWPGKSEDATST